MRLSAKFALRVAVIGVGLGTIIAPAAVTHAVTGPQLSVTPNQNLHNLDVVSVTGSGFAPSSTVFITECSSPTAADCDQDTSHVAIGSSDASGNVAATDFTVRVEEIGSGFCPPTKADGQCLIVATTNPNDPSAAGAFPISFDPVGEAVPATNLKDGQAVTFKGSGFIASSPFAIVECHAATGAAACDTADAVLGSTTANGTISQKFNVKTGVIGDGHCNQGEACVLVATTKLDPNNPDPHQTAVAPILFKKVTTQATKTTASFSRNTDKIKGHVTAGGVGVKGKTNIEIRKHGHWKLVDTVPTSKSGKFSDKLRKSGTYEARTPKQGGLLASHSKKIKVRV